MMKGVFQLLLGTAILLLRANLGCAMTLSSTGTLVWSLSECPSGWTNLKNDPTYKGRTVLAVSEGSSHVGTVENTALTSFDANPTHAHSFSFTMTLSESAARFVCTETPTSSPIPNFAWSSSPSGSRVFSWSSSSPNTQRVQNGEVYPSIVLNLCRLQSGSYFIPQNIVFMTLSSSCPFGSDELSNSAGRLPIFASSTRTTIPATSSASALDNDDSQIGRHTHTLAPFSSALQGGAPVPTSGPSSCPTSGSGYRASSTSSTPTWTNTYSGYEDLGIPFVRLTLCASGNSGNPNSLSAPPSTLIFFNSANSCPTGYIEATGRDSNYSKIAGRVMYSQVGVVGTPGATFGASSQMSIALSNSPSSPTTTTSHTHTVSTTSYTFEQDLKCTGGNTCSASNDIAKAIGSPSYAFTKTSGGPSSTLELPVIVLRGCTAMDPPTSAPSVAPSTSKPSRNPSTSKPSRTPSKVPTTSKPSKAPSHNPTTSKPSRTPSKIPTTSKPSAAPSHNPTTSKPSKSPSRTPSTSVPSRSPSKVPTTSKPSTTPSGVPTTSKPSKTPSSTPTTANPTRSPSGTPSTSKPTVSPSHNPSTSKPSRSPSVTPSSPKPTGSPSKTPSNVPSTTVPSRSPSTRPTTASPSRSPSAHPSTSKPSYSPSSTPSKKPSANPSTSRPSKTPSATPSTSKPSRSPSRTPSTSKPSRSPSGTPTTSKPSNSPAVTPPTMKPSGSPSATPTSAKPSKSPSKAPTTAKPSRMPSRAPVQPTKMPVISTSSPSPLATGRPSVPLCRPMAATNNAACKKRIKSCKKFNIVMKWAGRGCVGPKKKLVGDGGCQCSGYCGYTCQGACNADKQCKWAGSICTVRATGEPGVKITQCYPPN